MVVLITFHPNCKYMRWVWRLIAHRWKEMPKNDWLSLWSWCVWNKQCFIVKTFNVWPESRYTDDQMIILYFVIDFRNFNVQFCGKFNRIFHKPPTVQQLETQTIFFHKYIPKTLIIPYSHVNPLLLHKNPVTIIAY